MQVSPAFAQAPALRCPVGPLWLWYCAPAGAVAQLTEACVFTPEMAEWLVGPAYAALAEHFGAAGRLRAILDLRLMLSRELLVRSVFKQAGSSILSIFSHLLIVQPIKPPPMYLVTLKGSAALLSAFGPDVRVVPSLGGALAELGLQPEAAVAS